MNTIKTRLTGKASTTGLAAALLVTAPLASFAEDSDNLAVAERFVDAFYSFDPEPLSDVLANAGESKAGMLFYQGWANGGNYIVMQRMPCKSLSDTTVSCSITVQDDLVLALGIEFNVTDTFTLTFTDGEISAVDTSSNDPQLYHDAREWVWDNRSEQVHTPCRGSDDTPPDANACVNNMLKGYQEYASLNGLTPREPA